MSALRIGQGYDVHAFTSGDHVMLGGERVPHSHGVLAHSDGDVLLHAICDALLGAAGLGDIGEHFPDSDERWRDADSIELLRAVRDKLRDGGYTPVNIDATIACETPKLSPFRNEMRTRLAEAAELPADAVNVKFTTAERMGFVGRGEGMAALAIATLASGRSADA
jgi:2-C-methyl-D-erythritol 2,4-cyclodiphosphate synthase